MSNATSTPTPLKPIFKIDAVGLALARFQTTEDIIRVCGAEFGMPITADIVNNYKRAIGKESTPEAWRAFRSVIGKNGNLVPDDVMREVRNHPDFKQRGGHFSRATCLYMMARHAVDKAARETANKTDKETDDTAPRPRQSPPPPPLPSTTTKEDAAADTGGGNSAPVTSFEDFSRFLDLGLAAYDSLRRVRNTVGAALFRVLVARLEQHDAQIANTNMEKPAL